ncbi:MAG: pyruvate formate lyase activating enzyme [Candidatus Magnetoglobus multicellularis str. Araruama]|uniref:Pyruvate formate lyase activating enzyme n=1 Tax=Candidatus Magnetoglobus multicellularis str. Araruama TaxID=890399 RepID=A0A1V1NT18_9BACT|nr:MAG: pyruvate formate lyase activating enzyme [Candidatus Magnetoglobus multicellularis str. Araruama]
MLKIAGFIKTSLLDYPQKIASVIFLAGCNFTCPFCHNPELVKREETTVTRKQILWTEIKDYLQVAYPKLIDGVCISGGEPTLEPKMLKDLIERLKTIGLLVKLDTNGSHPDLLNQLPLDYLALDLKTSLERYSELTPLSNIAAKIKASLQYLQNKAAYDYEFRTTLVPGIVGTREIEAIGQLIAGSKAPWILQHYRNKQVLALDYQTISPYTHQETQQLVKCAQQYVPEVFLR